MSNETYVVHVTKECNAKCHYCYERDKSSTYTWEEIKKLLDNFIKYHPTKEFSIEFLGGEPMLAFDKIQKTVNYLEDRDDVHITGYTITTNGTIVHNELVDLMKEYPKIRWAASMDGTPYMNSLRVFKNGVNTYQTVIDNFKFLKENKIPDKKLSIHIVSHPYNIGYLSQGIEHLYNIGFRKIDVGTIESTIKIGKEYCDRFIEELNVVSNRIKAGKYPGLSVGVLENVKPRDDRRFYIRDSSGKIVGESYGRSGNDITTKNDESGYNATNPGSPLGDMIQCIREIVFINHQRNMEKDPYA